MPYQVTNIDQIAHCLPDGGPGQSGQLPQFFLSGHLIVRPEYALVDLFHQPGLQLEILRDGATFINDHCIEQVPVLSICLYNNTAGNKACQVDLIPGRAPA